MPENSSRDKSSECFKTDKFAMRLRIQNQTASLHIEGLSEVSAGSLVTLPVNPDLGEDDPNILLLRAMQAAGRAEMERQARQDTPPRIHSPQKVDLRDLVRFPALVD